MIIIQGWSTFAGTPARVYIRSNIRSSWRGTLHLTGNGVWRLRSSGSSDFTVSSHSKDGHRGGSAFADTTRSATAIGRIIGTSVSSVGDEVIFLRQRRKHSLDSSDQRFQLVADLSLVVDEECRRSVYSAAQCARHVFLHARAESMSVQIVAKSINIEPQSDCVFQQIRRLQRMLILEQNPVHLQEFPLRGGGFRGLGGQPGVLVQSHQGEIPKSIAQFSVESHEQSSDHCFPSGAMGAFVVAVLDEGHRRIGWSDRVIAIAKWLLQNFQAGSGSERHMV